MRLTPLRPAHAALAVVAFSLLARDARADGDSMVVDLGGATLETRRVTHGVFTQGSAPSEAVHEKDEEPAHQVTITRDFWIGKYPVTRGQFAKFVADTRYVTDAEKGPSGGAGWDGKQLTQKKDFTWRTPGFTQTDQHPVVLVSYGDANAFVGWAARKSGKRVRLPTEAEWEMAVRAGTSTPWYSGAADSDVAGIGWFKTNAGNGTRPVGQKRPNPLGIFDMSGNVFEWCRDVYAPYREGAVSDPETTTTAGEAERRVLRGGSWFRDPKRSRSAARHRNTPGTRNADNGFRVVVTTEENLAPGVTGSAPDFAPAGPLGAAGGSGGSNAGGGSAGKSGSAAADGSAAGHDGHDPARAEAGGGGPEISWGLLVASPIAAASAVVAWMLLRRKRPRAASNVAGARPRPTAQAAASVRPKTGARSAEPGAAEAEAAAAAAAGITTRAAADGFYVSFRNAPPGARLRFACMVSGVEVTDVVPLDGGEETFVYTGAHPTAIRVLEVTAPPAGYRTADPPPSSSSIPSSSPSPSPSPSSPRPKPPPMPARASASMTVSGTARMPAHLGADAPPDPVDVPFLEPELLMPSDARASAPIIDPGLVPPSEPKLEEPSESAIATTALPAMTAEAATATVEATESAAQPTASAADARESIAARISAISSGEDGGASSSDAFLGNPRAY